MKREFIPCEKALIVIGNATLVLGVIASVILAFTIVYSPKSMYLSGGYYNLGRAFNPIGLAYTIATLIGSITTWAIFLCIAYASENIRNIRFKDNTMAKDISQTEDKKSFKNLTFGVGIIVFVGVILYLILS